MNKRRRRRMNDLMNIILCLVSLISLSLCIFLLLKNYRLNYETKEAKEEVAQLEEDTKNYIYTQADVNSFIEEAVQSAKTTEASTLLNDIRERMENGESTISVLRDLYPEDVVVYADGGYNFFPITDDYQRHNYVLDNFVLDEETSRINYVNDVGEVRSVTGIDVSKHQGEIDWKKVAADGIDFAFIRAGYRGSTEGKLAEDECFYDNIEGALKNHIQVGVYFYTQAVTEKEAKEEAEFLLEMLEPYDITYPVVLDLEEVEGKSRTEGLSQEDFTDAAIEFLDTIGNAGYQTMIYGNLKTFFIMLDMSRIEKYDKWFAYYYNPVYFPYEFTIWQYSSTGKVDGIDGDVDLNVCMKEY